MDETTRRPPRVARRGHDVHQTHFFYPDDLASGATVRDHVTGEAVGEVDRVGRHVFAGYGAPSPDGGSPGDLVVEVRELDAPEPAAGTAGATGAAGADGADGEAEERQRSRWEHRERDDCADVDDQDDGERPAIGASVAQGVAIAVLAPLLALLVLVVLLVLLVG